MESKIITQGFDDQLVINTVQSLHFRDLYLGFFYEKVEEEKFKNSSEGVIQEFNEIYCDWALEEILKLGLVTIYHFWERCLRRLFKDQSEILNIPLTITERGKSFVQFSKETLEEDFSCSIDDEIWSLIDESRKIVNAYKHGDSTSFQSIKSNYPYYFQNYALNESSDLSECFFLGKNNFERLTSSIVDFWGKMPHTPRF